MDFVVQIEPIARARVSDARERLETEEFYRSRRRWRPVLKDLDRLGDLGRWLREAHRDAHELAKEP